MATEAAGRERALGAEHPKLAEALENYAVVMRKLEAYAEAEKAQPTNRTRPAAAISADGPSLTHQAR